MTQRPARYPAQGLPPGSRWWSGVSSAPGNRCWYRDGRRGDFRPAIAKRTAQRLLSRPGAMKSWRSPKLGASQGVNRLKSDWAEEALALTQDRGIDHIIETVGGENLKHSLRAVAVHGRISVIGVLAGTDISLPAGELLLKSPSFRDWRGTPPGAGGFRPCC